MEQRNKLQSERLDFLLDALKEDSIQYKNLQVGNSETEKRNAVRSLMNVRICLLYTSDAADESALV